MAAKRWARSSTASRDDPTRWADVDHLNGDGTAKPTDWLADQLDA